MPKIEEVLKKYQGHVKRTQNQLEEYLNGQILENFNKNDDDDSNGLYPIEEIVCKFILIE